jgi:S-adenosylmethionine-diacylglycerol 3-amino-3-carboxypropyl transferase
MAISTSTVDRIHAEPRAEPASFGARIYDRWFTRVHQSRLIYNTCWEDPRADRALLSMNANSRVVMLTSAGCNALDYLLDDVEQIDCIDMNPRQNALLELKIAALQNLSYEDFFALFGRGQHARFEVLYRSYLRPALSMSARRIWDQQLDWFSPRSRGSFYFRGAAGDVAWLAHHFLRALKPRLREKFLRLFDAQASSEQTVLWNDIEPELFNRLVRWVIRQPSLLTLLGVPRAQRDLISAQYAGGVSQYIQDKLRRVFAELPLQDNYFWRVYLTGCYSESCCPNYLKAQHFAVLRVRASRIRLHTSTLTEFLQRHANNQTTHFVLLDHQDWMAKQHPAALQDEWNAIIETAAPHAKVLLRSAALELNFLPQIALDNLTVETDASSYWHAHDRVGTYGLTWCAKLDR